MVFYAGPKSGTGAFPSNDQSERDLTRRPASELSPAQWLEANITHWTIETGLHARLDASRHDDRCRLRLRRPLPLFPFVNTRWVRPQSAIIRSLTPATTY